MNYAGQVCSGCGKLMSENEDIVVCPVCGTPQHRECWEENGECVNAGRHREKFVWQPESTTQQSTDNANAGANTDTHNTGSQRCFNCGGENSGNALTCVHCGAPLSSPHGPNPFQSFFNAANPPGNPFLYGVALDPESGIEGVKVKDMACFVQANSSRYIHRFKDLADKKKKFSFNWGAFFFCPYWFFYRRLWKVGLVFLGIVLAISLAFTGLVNDFQELYYSVSQADLSVVSDEEFIKMSEQLTNAMLKVLPMFALQGVVGIVAGFLGDSLYKREVVNKVKKLREKFPEDRAYEAASLRLGGSSIFVALTAYFGYNIIYQLLLNIAELLIN